MEGKKGNQYIKKYAPFIIVVALMLLSTFFSLIMYGPSVERKKIEYIPLDKFEQEIKSTPLQSLYIDKNTVYAKTASGKIIASKLTTKRISDFINQINKDKIVVYSFPKQKTSTLYEIINIASNVIPLIFLVLTGWAFLRMMQGKGFGFMSNRAKVISEEKPNIRLSDVAGIDEVKQELQDVVDYLKNPEKYHNLGGRAPKGVLLYGEPGVGKTYLAKAIAGESNVPFISISGSDFMEMFVGVGASRVRNLFETARKLKPCIIFIDEIDAVGGVRSGFSLTGHSEKEQTLNQLLVEMDGFSTEAGIIVIGATNRPDMLDPALLRPGRFDRQIYVPKPDLRGRLEILKVHAKGKKMAKSVNLEIIARATPGFSGAELENIINEATIIASRKGKQEIEQEDLEEALDKILMGLERKGMAIGMQEKRKIAVHEAGHAVMTILKDGSSKLHKVSIIPRGLALGVTASLPTEDKYLMSKKELLSMLYVLMGGRAAEEVFYGSEEITTGAENDLERATEIAYSMIGTWGMSDKIGPLSVIKRRRSFLLNERETVSAGSTMLDSVDEEVKKMLSKIYEDAKNIIQQYQEAVSKIADKLVDKETLSSQEVIEIVQTTKKKTKRGRKKQNK